MSWRPGSLPLAILMLGTCALTLFGARSVARPPASAHYAFGSGPTVVLVHGLGSRSGHWMAVARRLARHHHVVLVDLPGHGDTDMPEPFSLEQAEFALDRAIAEASSGPVVLVGHSLGGVVAAAEAMDHPGRVRSLVLVEAPLKQNLTPDERSQLLEGLDRDYRGLIEGAFRSFGRDRAQGAALWSEVSQLEPANIKPWIRLALSTDLTSRGRELRMPVLAVMAERSWAMDQTWSSARSEMGYDAIPNLTPLRLERCGHFVMLDRPAALALAIARFADAPEAQPVAMR